MNTDQEGRHPGSLSRIGRGAFWKLGWAVLLGVLHFGFEVARAIAERPPEASGGYASLSRLTAVTGPCYWLAVPWLLIALGVWLARWRRGPRSVVRRSEGWLALLVFISFLLATWALTTAQAQHIKLSY